MSSTLTTASPSRVVVGADLSPAGSAALLWAMRQARRSDGHVMVLDSRPMPESETASPTDDAARKDHRWQVQAWVSEVLLSVQNRVPVLVSTTEGRLELALAGAGSRADLVVYADDGTAQGRVEGDVLARFCPCPVVRVNRHQVPEYLRRD